MNILKVISNENHSCGGQGHDRGGSKPTETADLNSWELVDYGLMLKKYSTDLGPCHVFDHRVAWTVESLTVRIGLALNAGEGAHSSST